MFNAFPFGKALTSDHLAGLNAELSADLDTSWTPTWK